MNRAIPSGRAAGPSDRSRDASPPTGSIPIAIRNARGQFSKLVCVNAHDRCFGGADGECPYCEVKQ